MQASRAPSWRESCARPPRPSRCSPHPPTQPPTFPCSALPTGRPVAANPAHLLRRLQRRDRRDWPPWPPPPAALTDVTAWPLVPNGRSRMHLLSIAVRGGGGGGVGGGGGGGGGQLERVLEHCGVAAPAELLAALAADAADAAAEKEPAGRGGGGVGRRTLEYMVNLCQVRLSLSLSLSIYLYLYLSLSLSLSPRPPLPHAA